MNTAPHFRAYLNPQAALAESEQKALVEKYAPSETYTEGRVASARQDWITSLRTGNRALVPELFILAKATGGKDKRYTDLLLAMDAIHDRGAVVMEASTGLLSDDKAQRATMRDRAYAMLDGAVKSGKAGKPPLGFTDREIETMQAIMTSRHYGNWDTRRAAMEARGLKPPGRTWCLTELPKLAAKLGSVVEITPAVPKFRKAPSKRQLHPPSQVYFIRAGEAVKIGRSTKPYERIADLSTAHHHKLELLATIDGGSKEEKALHRKFAALRIKGEWFRYSAELSKFIAGIVRKSKRK